MQPGYCILPGKRISKCRGRSNACHEGDSVAESSWGSASRLVTARARWEHICSRRRLVGHSLKCCKAKMLLLDPAGAKGSFTTLLPL